MSTAAPFKLPDGTLTCSVKHPGLCCHDLKVRKFGTEEFCGWNGAVITRGAGGYLKPPAECPRLADRERREEARKALGNAQTQLATAIVLLKDIVRSTGDNREAAVKMGAEWLASIGAIDNPQAEAKRLTTMEPSA